MGPCKPAPPSCFEIMFMGSVCDCVYIWVSVGMSWEGLTNLLYSGQGKKSDRKYKSCPITSGLRVASTLQHDGGFESMQAFLYGHLQAHLTPGDDNT
eukprot:9043129-Karenia_brevis.AAC.1